MSYKKNIFLNSLAGVSNIVILICFSFIDRKLFLQSLGVELLGLGNTFSSIIAMISLADIGLGTAIIYHLYAPLEKQDYNKINLLMAIYRHCYMALAILVVIVAVILLPFLPCFLKDYPVDMSVYIYFGLFSANTAISYILSYKRCLFGADKKDYVCKWVDTGTSIFFSIVKICILLFAANYTLYLLANVCQTLISNLLIHYLCKRQYPDFHNVAFDIALFKKLMPDFKNLYGGKIAQFVFDSTDNLVISSFLNIKSVGLLAGYTIVSSCIKRIFNGIFGNFAVYFGRLQASEHGSLALQTRGIRMYAFAVFIFSAYALVPEYVLLQYFVVNVWGEANTLQEFIVILLVAEQYCLFLHEPYGCVLISHGDFVNSKRADTTAALVNIVMSVLLVQFYGVAGLLCGTILGNMTKYFMKSFYAYIRNFSFSRKKYLLENVQKLLQISYLIIVGKVSQWVFKLIAVSDNFVFNFLVGILLTEAVVTIFFVIFYRKTELWQLVYQYIKK